MNSKNEIEHASAPFIAPGDLAHRMRAGQMMNRGLGEDLNKYNNAMGDLMKFSGDFQVSKLSSLLQKPSSEKLSVGKKSNEIKAKLNPSGQKPTEVKKRRARKKWKKPKDKPNRPLSAYNLFFQAERASMLGDAATLSEQDKQKKRVHRKTHGKMGFAEMARSVGQKWKELPEEERKPYLEQAKELKQRYLEQLKVWKEEQDAKPKSGKSIVAALKAKLVAEREGASSESVEPSSSKDVMAEETQKLKKMAEELNQRNIVLMQQRSESEYLRALQEHNMALLASRSALADSSLFQYPSASEASANALLQQFQTGMPGAGLPTGALAGMGPMGMNMNMNSMGMNPMNMNAMNMNAMNMNTLGSMNMMAAADLQQRQAQMGAAKRLAHLRAGLGGNMGSLRGMDSSAMGTSNNSHASNGGAASGQGDSGRSQFPDSKMTAAMAMRLQNRFNM
jgi:hypothetical protein